MKFTSKSSVMGARRIMATNRISRMRLEAHAVAVAPVKATTSRTSAIRSFCGNQASLIEKHVGAGHAWARGADALENLQIRGVIPFAQLRISPGIIDNNNPA